MGRGAATASDSTSRTRRPARSSARCRTPARPTSRRAIDAAAAALEGWKSLAAIERARILRRSADLMRERKDEIGLVMTSEQGKPLAEATRRGRVRGQLPRVVRGRGRARLRPGGAADEPGEPRARAAPAGRRHRRDHAVELPGRDDDPQARPGAWPRAARASSSRPAPRRSRRRSCSARSRTPARRPASSTSSRRAIVRAWSPTTLFSDARVRKISFTGSTEVGKDADPALAPDR